jgi:2-keto-4-pentenoate hydratase
LRADDPDVLSERGRAIFGETMPGTAVPCARTTPLDERELADVVEAIARGREERRSVVLPESLRTRDFASVTQALLDLDARLGWDAVGWKIGAASREVQRAEGLPSPSPGRIYRATVFSSPARLAPELFINYRNVECEFAFRLGSALPTRTSAYEEDEVADAIESLFATLEIGDTVFEDWYGASGYFGACIDNGGGAALVCGEPITDWRALDLPNARMEISLNGQRVNEGYGRAAMGHPLTSLTWLVNWLGTRGRGLEAGEIVSTGTCTGHCFCAPGDHVSVDFGFAGVLTADFETIGWAA